MYGTCAEAVACDGPTSVTVSPSTLAACCDPAKATVKYSLLICFGKNAIVIARSVALRATTSRMSLYAEDKGYGAGFWGESDDSSNVTVNALNKVLIDDGASITGYEGVDLQATFAAGLPQGGIASPVHDDDAVVQGVRVEVVVAGVSLRLVTLVAANAEQERTALAAIVPTALSQTSQKPVP